MTRADHRRRFEVFVDRRAVDLAERRLVAWLRFMGLLGIASK
jgi:hypothetical protein